MKKEKKTKPDLPKELFWDVKYETLDYDKYAFFVIERVLQRGGQGEFKEIQNYYGDGQIAEVAKESRNLKPETYSYLSLLYNLNPEDLCITKQPPQQLWIY